MLSNDDFYRHYGMHFDCVNFYGDIMTNSTCHCKRIYIFYLLFILSEFNLLIMNDFFL